MSPRNVQRQVSRYLSIITAINFSLGLAAAMVLYALDVPNPFLWGAMVALSNFVPYLGAIASVSIMAIVGLLTFETPLAIVLPAFSVALLTILEGQFITPALAGRALSLSPVTVFIFLFLMGWAWGIVGVIVAIPLLASFRLICEDIESLRPVGIVLGK